MADGGTLISGAVLLAAREAMEDIAGPEALARAIDTLPPDARAEYLGLTPLSWISVSTAEGAIAAVAHELGREPLALMGEVTRINLHRTFSTLWRLLLRVTTDAALISRTPVLYTKSYNKGELVSRIVSPGKSEVLIRGWPDISLLQMEALRVAVETVLIVAGRREVKVIGARTTVGATFIATWMP